MAPIETTRSSGTFSEQWQMRFRRKIKGGKVKTRLQISSWAVVVMVTLAGACVGCHSNKPSAYRSIHGDARNGDAVHVADDLSVRPGDLELPDDIGLTPLHLAASACHTNVVVLLLDKGAKSQSCCKGRRHTAALSSPGRVCRCGDTLIGTRGQG